MPFDPDVATTFFGAGLIEAWGRGPIKRVGPHREIIGKLSMINK